MLNLCSFWDLPCLPAGRRSYGNFNSLQSVPNSVTRTYSRVRNHGDDFTYFSYNWIRRKLVHSYARSERCVPTTFVVWGSSHAISSSSSHWFRSIGHLDSFEMQPTWRHPLKGRDILAARFEYNFCKQCRPSLESWNLANFYDQAF